MNLSSMVGLLGLPHNTSYALTKGAVRSFSEALRAELARIPGVAGVQTSIAIQVTLDVPGLAEPAVGLLNSLPERGAPVLNVPYLRAGRLPESQTRTTRGEYTEAAICASRRRRSV